ncbi:Fur family transcriptional regulator [Autumnicola musiva]|uniref:Transcriptional repressor n=1 Tax=Autumnicola musiva TaxID=3075589 RepID=A0ABU3DAI9_9FLAO|nr:transcriptional repressor [Zunongwangia sp. F117]MDT0678547.1 transcriptional repressor [Zunongwangia sp. F117]
MKTSKNTRKTQHQKDVLELLKSSDKALTADEIRESLTGKINKTTVYRMLERFSDAGKVHLITGQEGKSYYAFCNSCNEDHENSIHNHLHFQCENCGHVECLSESITLPSLKGYEIHETQLLVIGICKKCK